MTVIDLPQTKTIRRVLTSLNKPSAKTLKPMWCTPWHIGSTAATLDKLAVAGYARKVVGSRGRQVYHITEAGIVWLAANTPQEESEA